MALTRDEWFEKLRSWVPSWFFTTPQYQEAQFKALAKILAQVQADAEETAKQAFIAEASSGYLDVHGSERTVVRAGGESDQAYSARIRYITNSAILSALQGLVNSSLNNGAALLIENHAYGFLGDDLFFDDEDARMLDGSKVYNWLTFVTPIQSGGDGDAIRASIERALDEAKAFGITYDVFYQT